MNEVVRIARALISSTTAAQQVKKIELNLGSQEVVELLAIATHIQFSAVAEDAYIGLYRKSDDVTTQVSVQTGVVEDTNWIYWAREGTGFVGFTGNRSKNRFILMPSGLTLIRSPQLVFFPQQVVSMQANVAIYYKIKTVSKMGLSRLLMKYKGK